MDDIKGKINNLTKIITKTSGDIVKQTKLNIGLANEEENLKSLYIETGKKVHEIYAYGGSLGKFFDEKYLQIKEQERVIAEIREKLNVTKGAKACPKCNATVDKAAEFCPKCGLRMSEELPKFPEPVKPQPLENFTATEKTKICPSCNAENVETNKFCLSCGRII